MKLNRGDTVKCPICGTTVDQESKVEDFVVPGNIGSSSEGEHDCLECGALFTVTCVCVDQYEVLPV